MPPHKPLSVVTTMTPTFLASFTCMNGCTYSGLASPRWAAMLRIFSLYGRAASIRSCALRILDAATISMALVIFLVFSTDLILPRISLPAAMMTPRRY
jgi:ABC-type multidrug transport system permease subunit